MLASGILTNTLIPLPDGLIKQAKVYLSLHKSFLRAYISFSDSYLSKSKIINPDAFNKLSSLFCLNCPANLITGNCSLSFFCNFSSCSFWMDSIRSFELPSLILLKAYSTSLKNGVDFSNTVLKYVIIINRNRANKERSSAEVY